MLEECTSTFLRPQALLALVVGLAACGQDRPTEPLAAFARATGDTLGVLRAVAAVIAPLQARHDSARASSNDLAPNYLERCPRGSFTCWDFGNAPWYAATNDRAVFVLAQLIGRQVERIPSGLERPPCPWPSRTNSTGLRAAVTVRFTHADTARVVLSRQCHYFAGRDPRAFGAHEAFEVVRSDGVWNARLTEVGVT